MTDELTARVAGMDIAADMASKYAVDTSLFDALVDKASSGGDSESATPAAAEAPRALKQRLLQPNDADIAFLADRLLQRLAEGHGECMFETGYEEGGASMELNDEDVKTVEATLTRVASDPRIDAFVQRLYDSGAASTASDGVTHARAIGDKPSKKSAAGARVANFLVRRRPQRVEDMLEVRVAVVGNVDAGKSTMLGVLTQGGLDDGRGRARLALFRHKHEADSGRTSSVGMEILGFDKQGAAIRLTDKHRKVGWDTVCRQSSKIVSFLDLAGHEKYLKTTVFGMAGGSPNFVMLMVAANAGLAGMAREHLGLALALGIPVFVVVTKIDMCPPQVLDTTLKQLTKLLRSSGCRKLPVAVADARAAALAAARFGGQRVCPVFQVSNVTGEGVGLLQMFLNLLPLRACTATIPASPREPASPEAPESSEPLRFEINEIFAVPYVGTVVSGVVASGHVRVGDMVWLGPDSSGHFASTQVRGIHRKRAEVASGSRGQSVSLALRKIARTQVRKGMVLLRTPTDDVEPPAPAARTFEAEVVVLYHSTTITSRYQAMVHCGAVRQTARVLAIRPANPEPADSSEPVDAPLADAKPGASALRTGDRARVLFQFIRHPEYVPAGSRLIFREGRTKGVGKVVRVFSAAEERQLVQKMTNGSMLLDHQKPKADVTAAHKISTKG